jgi:uncharacterized membrane protein
MTLGTKRGSDHQTLAHVRTITLPSILLGVGLGGLFDGIVFHQILQWHHMLSSTREFPPTTVAGLQANTLADGLFHLTTFVFVTFGAFMIQSRSREGGFMWSWRSLLGWGLVGWGLFNLVEAIVDHHILRIHHVRPGPHELAYDLGFLTVGAAMVILGWLVARADSPQSEIELGFGH